MLYKKILKQFYQNCPLIKQPLKTGVGAFVKETKVVTDDDFATGNETYRLATGSPTRDLVTRADGRPSSKCCKSFEDVLRVHQRSQSSHRRQV